MTDETKITLVKSMTNETDDDIISAFLSMAADAIYNYVDISKTHDKTEIIDSYGGVQVRIASAWLNKRGADGQLIHNENGIYRSYESGDIPSSILRELVPICGVVQ